MYTIRAASPPPQPFTRRPRPGGAHSIVQIQWHATRGATTMNRQVSATESWFASLANNRGGWGGSADYVLGPDFRVADKIVIVQFGDPFEEYGSWSAGSGDAGTFYAARHGVAIEVAQPAGRDRLGKYTSSPDANFEHYTPETIDACRWLVGHINAELVARAVEPVPSVWLDEWKQLPTMPIPQGHIGHEELANGKKLGKHDPGHLFPREELMAALDRQDDAASEDLGAIRTLRDTLDGRIVEVQSILRDARADLTAMELELIRLRAGGPNDGD